MGFKIYEVVISKFILRRHLHRCHFPHCDGSAVLLINQRSNRRVVEKLLVLVSTYIM